MKKSVWICYEGDYYDDQYLFEFIAGTKKTAEMICKREGYKYNKKQDLWLNDSEAMWRRIERVRYETNGNHRGKK